MTIFFIAEKQQLLNVANNSKFKTRNIVKNITDDQWNENYDVGNKITYNTEVLKSNGAYSLNGLSGLNGAYILVKDHITVTAAPATQVSFKNCAPFTKSITKIDRTTINDAEDLDLVMPIYNLI